MAAAAAALYAAGAVVVLGTLALPHDSSTFAPGVIGTAGTALGAGAFLWFFGRRVPTCGFQVLTVFATTLVSFAVLFGGHGYVAYVFLYLWISTYAYYFFSLRSGLLHTAYVAGTSAAVLLATGTPALTGSVRGVLWLMLVSTALVSGLFLQRLVSQVRHHALTDFLTGLSNRWAWDVALDEALHRPAGEPVAVALLDLDHFKVFNDEHGHQRGDDMLRELAAAWRRALRPADVIARYGGEEFAVLMPGCGAESAPSIVERLRDAVPSGHTASAGVAVWDGEESPEALMARADAALYDAKRRGRNRSVLAPAAEEAGEGEGLEAVARWSSPVLRALDERHLDFAFQPICSLDTLLPFGYEALARPLGEEGGVDGFFAAAQAMGKLVELDRLCLASAIRASSSLPAGYPLFLNVGIATVLDAERPLARWLPKVLDEERASRPLVLEITERETLVTPAHLAAATASLRRAGFRIAIDDLGAGRSYMEVLLAVTPEFLKLDRRLGTSSRRTAHASIAALVAYAGHVGATVVGEGIEEEAAARRLRALGVTLGQGYHLGRPRLAAPRERAAVAR